MIIGKYFCDLPHTPYAFVLRLMRGIRAGGRDQSTEGVRRSLRPACDAPYAGIPPQKMLMLDGVVRPRRLRPLGARCFAQVCWHTTLPLPRSGALWGFLGKRRVKEMSLYPRDLIVILS
jgi:hypothetical protein